jgi:MFS family permease
MAMVSTQSLMTTAIFGAVVIALPLLVRDDLHASAATYGVILSLNGAGQFLGAFAGAPLLGRLRGRWSLAIASLSGLAFLGIAAVPPTPVVFVLAAIDGVAFGAYSVVRETALQRSLDPAFRARAFSLDQFATVALGPLTAVPIAEFVRNEGAAAMYAIAGATVVVCGASLLTVRLPDAGQRGLP